MSDQYTREPLLDMFLFETSQLLEQLEQSILTSEKESCFTEAAINEIFRIMHTIKGSASMMLFDNIAKVAHSIEDLFFYLRKEQPTNLDCSYLSDLILEGIDFIKVEVEKIKENIPCDGETSDLVSTIQNYLSDIKNNQEEQKISKDKIEIPTLENEIITASDAGGDKYYISQQKKMEPIYANAWKAAIFFEEGCEMENIRAYTVIHNLKDITEEFVFSPENIIDSDDSIDVIRKDGFIIYLKTNLNYEQMYEHFSKTIFLKELLLTQIEHEQELPQPIRNVNKELPQDKLSKSEFGTVTTVHIEKPVKQEVENPQANSVQSIISVSVGKLDKLMDLMGEIVIAEAMVIENSDLQGLQLNDFKKAARQLSKITSELQDIVMSIRMIPLSATFMKMHRIVRDMSKKLDKEVHLDISGEDTEVDKNIIEHISDPLMHLVRNSIDHGIETTQERIEKGKDRAGTVSLEAKNAGSDVLIIVKDDGRGLSKEMILKKARDNGLLFKNEADMTDREIYNLILLPGFSTKDKVTEFSGRGVGMDVVMKNIEAVGGTLNVDSSANKGTMITLKIPLTLAIIDGMNIRVGNSRYTIPTTAIKESFRVKEEDIIHDPDGNEMIMVRGCCYQIQRLHKRFNINTSITNLSDGIIIMIEQDEKIVGLFVDALLDQQQVVVKALPKYILNLSKLKDIAGCTLLGDGSISLILDVGQLL